VWGDQAGRALPEPARPSGELVMEMREWSHLDKRAWERGPWDDEPDKVQWRDEATGLPCLAVRNERSGNWCGYVGVSERHPAFGLNYYHSTWDAEQEGQTLTPVQAAINAVSVHGGLTFADKCHPSPEGEGHGICHVPAPGEPDHVWWFGFDCAHSGDVSPGYSAELRFDWPGAEYRVLAYVKSECRDLARQLQAIA
jgi:hypothetical protein